MTALRPSMLIKKNDQLGQFPTDLASSWLGLGCGTSRALFADNTVYVVSNDFS